MVKKTSKKWLACLCMLSMAGWASAISWAPATNASGTVAYWDIADNWSTDVLPAVEEKVQFSSTILTECVVRDSRQAGQIVMGDGGSSSGLVSVRIANGGTLNGNLAGGSWVGVGYSRPAHCVVEAGGLLNVGTRLGVGMVPGGNGLLEVYGDVVLTGNLQVDAGTGDKGVVQLYGGGTILAATPEIGDNGLIDIWQDGVLTFVGDDTVAVSNFIASGKIVGNRLTNNIIVTLDTNTTPGVTNTVITVPPSIPNLAGLMPSEATNVLAVFGYVVGNITEGNAGALTGSVIGQSPAAGSAPIASNSPIDIVIQGAGSVPNVVGEDYAVATNMIAVSGFILGVQDEVYIFDSEPGLVTAQDPGAADPNAQLGDPVNITFNERKAASSITVGSSGGDWNNPFGWSLGAVPERETQNYEVQIRGGATYTLTNFVAMRRIHLGHNGAPGVAQLDVMDGGHVMAGMYADYAAVGWNVNCVLNVYTNGIFESRGTALRVGWNGSSATINIDGGSVLVPTGWMSLGRTGLINPVTTNEYASTINIKNGGRLLINYLSPDHLYGTITLAEGTFATTGTSTTDIENGLASGLIVMAPGYVSTLTVIDGNATLTGLLPGYSAWAGGWGVDIGAETNDYDGDLVDNMYEYMFDGNPTNGAVTGVAPVMTKAGGEFIYTHVMRNDDPLLTYTVETSTNLLDAAAWTNFGYSVLGTNVTGGDYDVVTNLISTVEGQKFIRVKVMNP